MSQTGAKGEFRMAKLVTALLVLFGVLFLGASESPKIQEHTEQYKHETVSEAAAIVTVATIVRELPEPTQTATAMNEEHILPTLTPTAEATQTPMPTPSPTVVKPYKIVNGMVELEAVCKLSSYDPHLCLVETAGKEPPQWMVELGYTAENVNFSTNCHPTKQSEDDWYLKGELDIRNFYGEWAACPSEISFVYDEEAGYNQYTGTEIELDGIGNYICRDTGGDVVIKGMKQNSKGKLVPYFVVDLLHDYYSGPPNFSHIGYDCTITMTPEQLEVAKSELGLTN
jgi:hypothetical protein